MATFTLCSHYLVICLQTGVGLSLFMREQEGLGLMGNYYGIMGYRVIDYKKDCKWGINGK